MAPNILEGDTLGQKHFKYNLLVKEAIANKQTDVKFPGDGEDLSNLAKIDIASHNRDLEYILKVLASEDLLYVSRAINKCTWLITDNAYSHIINPEYLTDNLFPHMTSKAKLKLIKHIRNNIKDEERAQKFYYWEDTIQKSLKWLPKCSVPFIEDKVFEHCRIIKPNLLKRLCERSVNVINNIIQNENDCNTIRTDRYKSTINSLKKIDTSLYLDIIEKMLVSYKSNARTTLFIMKSCPDRVFKNFYKYAKFLHLPTFSKFVKKEDIKEFLYTQANMMFESNEHYSKYYRYLTPLFKFSVLRCFIYRMPKEQQYQFVKDVFIDKIHDAKEVSLPELELSKMKALHKLCRDGDYRWYEFAPFEIAFEEIVKLVKKSHNNMRNDLFMVLIKSTKNNYAHLQTVLKYYQDKHSKDTHELTYTFITSVLTTTNFCEYDENTWNIVDNIFNTLDVYIDSNKTVSTCVEVVLIYKLIKKQPIANIIERKFEYNSLKKYKHLLNNDEKEQVFNYLVNFVPRDIPHCNEIEQEDQLTPMIKYLRYLLTVLKVWEKDIKDYPIVLQKIKEVTELKINSTLNANLTFIYDMKKSWRKYMFEESLLLKPSEEVCINALKHDPKLLTRHEDKVMTLLFNNDSCLKLIQSKIRIHWSETIAKEWIEKYMSQLEQSKSHKAIVRGLYSLLPQNQMLEFTTKYIPESKINWMEVNENILSLTKQIAKNMHRARPQPSPSVILLYAKGDFLQFVIPSLLAVYYNLSAERSREHIPILLNARVSLQKHGIRFAITKLKHEDVMKEFTHVWTITKNASIRCTLFESIYDLICKATNNDKIEELWQLLKMFIDNLTFKEDKKVYDLLCKIDKIPLKIKPSFIENSYEFLETYVVQLKEDNEKLQYSMQSMVASSVNIIEHMNEDFVLKIISGFVEREYMSKELKEYVLNVQMLTFLSTYILCAQDEETQTTRYNNVLLPLFFRSVKELKSIKYMKHNLYKLIHNLRTEAVNYAKKDKIIPVKIFTDFYDKLNSSLEIPEHYVIIRQWKLTLELIKVIQDSVSKDRKFPENWLEENAVEPKQLGAILLDMLKSDISAYYPSVQLVFESVLSGTFNRIVDNNKLMLKIVEAMLSGADFIPAYLVILKVYKDKRYESDWKQMFETRFLNHPSMEVQMHYNYYCNDRLFYF